MEEDDKKFDSSESSEDGGGRLANGRLSEEDEDRLKGDRESEERGLVGSSDGDLAETQLEGSLLEMAGGQGGSGLLEEQGELGAGAVESGEEENDGGPSASSNGDEDFLVLSK